MINIKGFPTNEIQMLYRMHHDILPGVNKKFEKLEQAANLIRSEEYKKQALDAQHDKKFHCQGGCSFATANLENKNALIEVITSFQTICDYLDNICDRLEISAAETREIHRVLFAACDLENVDELLEGRTDKDYLLFLINTCKQNLKTLPSFETIKPLLKKHLHIYVDYQVFQQIPIQEREVLLQDYWKKYQTEYPDLTWYEFYCSIGSTIVIYSLFLVAASNDLTLDEARQIESVYFPYITSMHVLTDYIIDKEEDELEHKFNVSTYYPNNEALFERLEYLLNKSRERANNSAVSKFHLMMINFILALYLVDSKVKRQAHTQKLIKKLMQKNFFTLVVALISSYYVRYI